MSETLHAVQTPETLPAAVRRLVELYTSGRILSWEAIGILAWLVAEAARLADGDAKIVGSDGETNGYQHEVEAQLYEAIEIVTGEPIVTYGIGGGLLIKFLVGRLVEAILAKIADEGGMEAAIQLIREIVQRLLEK